MHGKTGESQKCFADMPGRAEGRRAFLPEGDIAWPGCMNMNELVAKTLPAGWEAVLVRPQSGGIDGQLTAPAAA
jgi:hypothetical protein